MTPSKDDTANFQQPNEQPKQANNWVLPLAIITLPLLIGGGLIAINKDHPTVKPHWDKMAQFFGKKPTSMTKAEIAKLSEKMKVEDKQLLASIPASDEQHLELIVKVLEGDFDAWNKVKPILKQQYPEQIEPLLKQSAMKGHIPFIQALTDFYLEQAGIISEPSRDITVNVDEAKKKLPLYKPAYIWLHILDRVNDISVPKSLQEMELRIKMRRGTDESWDKLEASLIAEAQPLIETIQKNIIARLDDNLNGH